jgi:hypothetical protein
VHEVGEDLQRDLGADGESGLADPLLCVRPEGAGPDEDPPAAVGSEDEDAGLLTGRVGAGGLADVHGGAHRVHALPTCPVLVQAH